MRNATQLPSDSVSPAERAEAIRAAVRADPGKMTLQHAAELGVSGGCDQVGRAGPEGREADASAPSVAAVGRGHEAGALFVAGEDQLDFRRPGETVEKIQILLAGDAKDIFDALFFQTLYK